VRRLLMFLVFFLSLTGLCRGADIGRIVRFVVRHNPEIAELKKLNGSILSDIKVEAYAGAGISRQDIGITATLPLLSPQEMRRRRMEAVNKELVLSQRVSEAVGLYLSEMVCLEHEEKLLQSLYNELQWLGERVQAGVDSQKTYNDKLHNYIERRRDFEKRKITNEALLASILSFVPEGFRKNLKRLIHEAVSENKKAERQDISLHQEGPKR